ncbi:unnamed protein product [Rodentolepis nana]|uniref:ADP-ribosylation factor-related protein 1 n=1 Tax=Rodentolepis nana TaxID=102285 RepID=A0A0R3TKX9_RODNA|nr:unnamed protein product [Rodentolepis nana]
MSDPASSVSVTTLMRFCFEVDRCILFQDLNYAIPMSEIIEILDTKKLTGHIWHLQPTCALTGAGVIEGIEWLYNELMPHKDKPRMKNFVRSRGWRCGTLGC